MSDAGGNAEGSRTVLRGGCPASCRHFGNRDRKVCLWQLAILMECAGGDSRARRCCVQQLKFASRSSAARTTSASHEGVAPEKQSSSLADRYVHAVSRRRDLTPKLQRAPVARALLRGSRAPLSADTYFESVRFGP